MSKKPPYEELERRVKELTKEAVERKHAEEMLRQSEERYRDLFNSISDLIMTHDMEGRLLSVNPAVCKTLGYTSEEMIGRPISDFIVPKFRPLFRNQYLKQVKEQGLSEGVVLFQARDRTKHYVEYRNILLKKEGSKPYVSGSGRDITQRVYAERALRESEEKFRKISASAHDAIIIIDNEDNISFWNDAAQRMSGYSSQETLGKKCHRLLAPKRYHKAFTEGFRNFKTTGQGPAIGKTLQLEGRKKGGTEFAVELSLSAMKLKGKWNAIGILRDITERKQAQKAIEFAHTELNQIFNGAADAMCVIGKNHKVLRTNQTLSSLLGIDQNDAVGRKCFDVINNSLCRTPICPLSRIHNGIERIEYEAEIKRNQHVTIPCILTATPFMNSEGKMIGIVEDLKDIRGLKRSEEELKDTLKKLRKAMKGSIRAMASTVEMRDPYTSGHQARVADLARAIAREMDLSREQIDGIRLAGLIHDLGKISTPAEILGKPGQLNQYEFGIIRSHPQVGYDILKEIEFPWPIAQIILQHHEMMDGSGYPQGLTGEDILVEARILAVADIVEAMSSHRPYRPALGIDKALEEISQNRGVLYDPNVVDACFRLFTEKGFEFR